MGTRNLTVVLLNDEHKVAQYGQWDGYPTGQGKTICEFLQNGFDLEQFKKTFGKCRFLDAEGHDKEFVESYNKNAPSWSNEPDNRTPEQKHWFDAYVSRDLGASILQTIADSTDREIVLRDELDFATDGSCEWAYVLDLDNEKLEVFDGGFPSLAERNPLAVYSFADATPEAMEALESREEDE